MLEENFMKNVEKIIPLLITLLAGKSIAGDTYNCSFTYLVKDQAGINADLKVVAKDGPNKESVIIPELNKVLTVLMNKTNDESRKGSHDVRVRLHDKNESFPIDPFKEITLIGSLSNKSKYIYLSSHIYETSYVFQCEKQ